MIADSIKIVVVDDNPDMLDTLALLLRADGYDVRTASSGAEALAVVEEFDPLCILMDIRMPGMSGHELSRTLRQRYGNDIVLVAVTGWGSENDCISEQFSQFDHYLRKPWEPAQLRKCLPPP